MVNHSQTGMKPGTHLNDKICRQFTNIRRLLPSFLLLLLLCIFNRILLPHLLIMECCPPEITNIIASHLTKRDHLHCILVSKTWSDIFIPHLWRNLHVSRDLKQVRALDTPEFSEAVLRHGRHILSLCFRSYSHLRPFLQQLPSPNSPKNITAPTPLPCVQNLRQFKSSDWVRSKDSKWNECNSTALCSRTLPHLHRSHSHILSTPTPTIHPLSCDYSRTIPESSLLSSEASTLNRNGS